MKNVNLLFPQPAYLLVGRPDYWREVLSKELQQGYGIATPQKHPDVRWEKIDTFGVKEAHDLIAQENRQAFGASGRFFIFEINYLTAEAQNALLKTLEEPNLHAHFFFLARTDAFFLPTFLSRLVVVKENNAHQIKVSGAEDINNQKECLKFLKLDLPERLDYIQENFLKEKNKKDIADFVIGLEIVFHQQIKLNNLKEEEKFALNQLERARAFLINPRSSARLILEHLALILP